MCTVAYASLMVELQQGRLHIEDERTPNFSRETQAVLRFICLGVGELPSCALFSCQRLSKPPHV